MKNYNTMLMKGFQPSMAYKSGEDFENWQSRVREKLSNLLGLDHYHLCDDKFEIEFEKEHPDFAEIRFRFQSEEGYFVPCHFLIPNGSKGKLPTAICLQGHSKGMHISLGRVQYPGDENSICSGDRDFALQAVKNGMCALTVEQRGMGECGGTEEGPQCYMPAVTGLLIGRPLLGGRVWDVSRAIDILEKHFPIVDMNHLICVGNSGGGTTTFYAACMDTRIKTAIPSCSVCTYEASIAAMRHCICNYIPEIRNYLDMGDLGGLIAPRNLVVVAGKHDEIFPLDGVRQAYATIESLYAASGSKQCRLVLGEEGHRFYAEQAWKAYYDLQEEIG